MNIEIIVYLAALAVVYLYTNYRNSFAYIWLVIYVLIAWPIEESYSGNLAMAYVLLGLCLIAAFECLVRINRDPFSARNIRQVPLQVMKSLGLGPKTKLIKASDHDAVVKARKYIQREDWRSLDKYIRAADDEARHTIYSGLSEDEQRPEFIDQWLAQAPDSDVAARLSGFSYITTGWAERGDSTADLVSSKGWERFFADLELAEQEFKRAIRINDNCYTSYVGLIIVAMGAQIGAEKLWKYFARGTALSPHNYNMHYSMVHACAAKWGGDASDMFKVALKASEEAPPGSAVVGSLAIAHVEQWLSLDMVGEEIESQKYFQQLSVKDDLKHIASQLQKCDSSEFSAIEAKSVLAFCLEKAEMYIEFRELISSSTQHYVEYPWFYYEESMLGRLDSGYALDHVLKKHGLLK